MNSGLSTADFAGSLHHSSVPSGLPDVRCESRCALMARLFYESRHTIRSLFVRSRALPNQATPFLSPHPEAGEWNLLFPKSTCCSSPETSS